IHHRTAGPEAGSSARGDDRSCLPARTRWRYSGFPRRHARDDPLRHNRASWRRLPGSRRSGGAIAQMSTGHPPEDTTSKEPARIANTRSITRSAQETFQLGVWIGEALRGPAIFLLRGELGAGKTLLAKGIAAGLDIDPADVTSPSFTLVNIHE